MDAEILELGSLRLDIDRCIAVRRGHSVRLGEIECRLLAALMRAAGSPVSVASLGVELWGPEQPHRVSRVRGAAPRLRSKFHSARLVETIGGEGYRIAIE